MRQGGGAGLSDGPAAGETLETEDRVEWMRLAARDRVSKDPTRARRGLESARAPAAVEIEPFDRQLADDRRGVRADVDDASPAPHHPHAREDREELHERRHLALNHMEGAALR